MDKFKIFLVCCIIVEVCEIVIFAPLAGRFLSEVFILVALGTLLALMVEIDDGNVMKKINN